MAALSPSGWFALFAPKGTPKEIIDRLNATMVRANSVVRSRLADLGFEIFPAERLTPEALSAFHKAQIDEWWPIQGVRDHGGMSHGVRSGSKAERLTASISRPQNPNYRTKYCDAAVFQPWVTNGHLMMQPQPPNSHASRSRRFSSVLYILSCASIGPVTVLC